MANKLVSNLPWILPAVAVGAFASVGFETVMSNFRTADATIAPQPAVLAPQQQTQQVAPVVVPQPVVVAQPEASTQLAELLNQTGAEAATDVEVTRNEGFSIDVLETALDNSLEPVTPEAPAAQPVSQTVDTDFFNAAQARLEMDVRCVADLRKLASQARVYFPSGGLTGGDVGISQAKVLGTLAQQCPGVTIQVLGHSDASGNPVTNQALSEQRAQAVITRVAAFGINPSLFEAVGMGSAVPSGLTGPEPAAYYDRRVEFAIVENSEVVQTSANVRAFEPACVGLLREAVTGMSIEYPARGMTISDADLAAASNLARIATSCPQARLRLIGQHDDAFNANENPSIGRLRSIILMTKLVNEGYPADQIIIAGRSSPLSVEGLKDGRVDFDFILEN